MGVTMRGEWGSRKGKKHERIKGRGNKGGGRELGLVGSVEIDGGGRVNKSIVVKDLSAPNLGTEKAVCTHHEPDAMLKELGNSGRSSTGTGATANNDDGVATVLGSWRFKNALGLITLSIVELVVLRFSFRLALCDLGGGPATSGWFDAGPKTGDVSMRRSIDRRVVVRVCGLLSVWLREVEPERRRIEEVEGRKRGSWRGSTAAAWSDGWEKKLDEGMVEDEERKAPMGMRFHRWRSERPPCSWLSTSTSDSDDVVSPSCWRTDALSTSSKSKSIMASAETKGEGRSPSSPEREPSVTEGPEVVETFESARVRREGVPSSCKCESISTQQQRKEK